MELREVAGVVKKDFQSVRRLWRHGKESEKSKQRKEENKARGLASPLDRWAENGTIGAQSYRIQSPGLIAMEIENYQFSSQESRFFSSETRG